LDEWKPRKNSPQFSIFPNFVRHFFLMISIMYCDFIRWTPHVTADPGQTDYKQILMKGETVLMQWKKWGRVVMIVTALTVVCTACNYRDYFQKYSGYDYGSRPEDKKAAPRVLRAQEARPDPAQHDNKRLAYSPELSKRIAELPGVYNAFVFVTDRNAYVGMMTDLSATGIRALGDREEEQASSGKFTHKNVPDISSRMLQKITDEIFKAEPTIRNVYISANREYVNQLIEFAKEAWAGRSLEPLLPEFNRLVKYVFAGGKEIPVPLNELRLQVPGPLEPVPQASAP